MNSARIYLIFTQNIILEPMVMVECVNNAPILNFKISLQKSNEMENNYVMTIDEMKCMIWKLEVKIRAMQKEPSHLEFWFES
jgi:hypothetical protein